MKISTIIFGVTGMVGEGVLHECLKHPEVSSILVINRRPCHVQHKKLKEIVHKDFFDLSSIKNRLSGFNACFFCMGVSVVGRKEKEYSHLTYDLTLNVANILAELNPNMTYCYVSGAGTDSTESGRTMWARVKGKTENNLMQLPFKAVYMFRPGYIQPTKGLKNGHIIYKFISPLYPIFKILFPKYITSLKEIGLAMIHIVQNGYKKSILECKDIVTLSRMAS